MINSVTGNSKTYLILCAFLLLALEIIRTVFLLKPLYPTRCINVLLLACIKWMTHRANLRMYLLGCTASLKRVPAPAANLHCMVFGMYLFLHKLISLETFKPFIISTRMLVSIYFFYNSPRTSQITPKNPLYMRQ